MSANNMRCVNCGVEVIRLKRIQRPKCIGCQRAANRASIQQRRATLGRASRASNTGRAEARRQAAGALQRQACDRALNAGKCCRRCDCGQLYHLEDMESRCPVCQNHLSDNPLEVSRAQVA